MFTLEQVVYKDILQIDRLHIPDRQVTCIIGESGSGKSTLLRLLNQLISADGGSIFFHGHPIDQIHPVSLRRRVVMVPQTPVLFGQTIREDLLAGLSFSEKAVPGDDTLGHALEIVCLNKQLSEETESLSGGEKQRLSLARGLLLEPEAFLLDEPTSALDEDTEDSVIGNFIQAAKEKEQTLIIVTHARRIAEEYADQIVEIQQGRVIGVRHPKETKWHEISVH